MTKWPVQKLTQGTTQKLTQKTFTKTILFTYSYFSAMKTDNSLFCYRDSPSIHYGYCISNAVDCAKKNNFLPTMVSTFSLELRGQK